MRVERSDLAIQDMVGHFAYIGADNLTAADKFLASAESTFHQLAEMPLMGRRTGLPGPHNASLRQWRVRGFDNYLIFYRPIADGIEIVRVLHGARDLESLFDAPPEDETT